MDIEKIIAMAVATVAEDNGLLPENVTVCSFREIQKSSLEKYIEHNHIHYQKFELGVSRG